MKYDKEVQRHIKCYCSYEQKEFIADYCKRNNLKQSSFLLNTAIEKIIREELKGEEDDQ